MNTHQQRIQLLKECNLRLQNHKLSLEIEALQVPLEGLQSRVDETREVLGSLVAKLLDCPAENIINLSHEDLLTEAQRVETKILACAMSGSLL